MFITPELQALQYLSMMVTGSHPYILSDHQSQSITVKINSRPLSRFCLFHLRRELLIRIQGLTYRGTMSGIHGSFNPSATAIPIGPLYSHNSGRVVNMFSQGTTLMGNN